MNSKITKALSFFSGLTRGASKPSTAPAKTGTTRPASNAALSNLARLNTSSSAAASLISGAARPRLSARDLARAGAMPRARAQALATAREVARIQALPSPALPLDLQKRFDALKAGMPKAGRGNAPAGRKPPMTGEKRDGGLSAAVSVHVNVSLSAPVTNADGRKADGAKVEEPKTDAPKVEGPKVEAPKVEVPKAEAPKVEAPKVEAPKVEAPKVEGPKVEAPKVEVPKAEDPKAEDPKAEDEGPKTEGPKTEGVAGPIADAHQELSGLEGKVHDHVNAMHNAVAAHPAQPPYDLFQQEMAELQQLAILISRILQRLVQHSGQALLSITRN
ncbi:hypothetical protein GWC77_07455 [Paraburkholderia sp. NMBU_R16]|uniref:hypothetical protein n=1 Tax=Paraburkholderia sp. NMBU_R16 TaxID=2698676 RepID=UPI00156555B5|nr:hypothetical protein [Paraburkholderia sp. NMBU_R16]NRO95772.1 hypothetical protein [Paraburkholderia sp. NMBU_R16]